MSENGWEYIPKSNACEKCQAMKGLMFAEKPGPVHPNCKCEVRQVALRNVIPMRTLQGYGDHATEKFHAGQKIIVKLTNGGVHVAGATIRVDETVVRQTGHLLPGKSIEFEFTKFGEPPLWWEVYLIYTGGDNSNLLYFILG